MIIYDSNLPLCLNKKTDKINILYSYLKVLLLPATFGKAVPRKTIKCSHLILEVMQLPYISLVFSVPKIAIASLYFGKILPTKRQKNDHDSYGLNGKVHAQQHSQ